MRWQVFSQLKFYISAGIAMVGLSAASTLLTTQPSVAQSPAVPVLESSGEATYQVLIDKARAGDIGTRRILAVQNQNPKLAEVREEPAGIDDLVSEDLRSVQQRVTVRSLPNGTTIQEIVAEPQFPAVIQKLTEIDLQHSHELQKATDTLKSKSATDEAKASAKQKIESILSEQFDADMTQRGQQVEQLEKQIALLKEQMEKRRAAKDRLIELRLELLINESEGLGFPNAWQSPPTRRLLGTTGAPLTTPNRVQIYRSTVPPVPPAPPAAQQQN